jgi:hypothetical protein
MVPLESRLLAMSTPVITTDTEDQDIWGGPIGLTVGAVRIGNKVLLSSHSDSGDPKFALVPLDPPHNEIEMLVDLKDVLSKAYEVYSGYGYDDMGYEVKEFITRPQELADCRVKIGRLLNRRYVPPIGIRPTKPSEILGKISRSESAEDPYVWAWFDGTLYLTASAKTRDGRHSFDASLYELFSALKFPVKCVKVARQRGTASFQDRILASLALHQSGRE